MILYVLRHAEAVAASDDLPDEWRYLTEEGGKQTGEVSLLRSTRQKACYIAQEGSCPG